MFRRRASAFVLTMLSAAALTVAAAGLCLAADGPKPPKGADKIQEAIRKLYGKSDFKDSSVKNDSVNEMVNLVLKEKDRKASALKSTAWWSSAILEALYTNDKHWIKYKPSKGSVDAIQFDTFPNGPDKPAFQTKCAIRGPNKYLPQKPCALIISVVDSKTDPKAYLEKAWGAVDDIKNEWVLLCVPESDGFDLAKSPVNVAYAYLRAIQAYHVDPNRVYLEGVGTATRGAQIAANSFADRLAGLILRNPTEALVSENCGILSTLVIHGPEGNEKAIAVATKAKELCGDAQVAVFASPDVASLDGMCQGAVDWLKVSKPRELARSYTWNALFDKDQNCANAFTGNLVLKVPQKPETPTRAIVAFDREKGIVDIKSTNLAEFRLLLNDELLDLDREVTVFVNGKEIDRRVFDRRTEDMLDFADVWGEYGRLFPVYADYSVPVVIEPKKDGDKKDEPNGGGEKK